MKLFTSSYMLDPTAYCLVYWSMQNSSKLRNELSTHASTNLHISLTRMITTRQAHVRKHVQMVWTECEHYVDETSSEQCGCTWSFNSKTEIILTLLPLIGMKKTSHEIQKAAGKTFPILMELWSRPKSLHRKFFEDRELLRENVPHTRPRATGTNYQAFVKYESHSTSSIPMSRSHYFLTSKPPSLFESSR